MDRFEVLSLTQANKWNNYLRQLPVEMQDIYYTPEYYQLYEDNGDGKAQSFVYEREGDIAIYPYLLNSVNDFGYDLDNEYFDIQGAYGYNGVLSSSFNLNFITSFYKAFSIFCKENSIVAEFTRFNPYLGNHVFSRDFINVIKDRETVYLDLIKEYHSIWDEEFSSKNRNMIRKATKLGCFAKVINSPSYIEIEEFIDLYNKNMAHIGAENYYYFNRNFFHKTFAYLQKNTILINVCDSLGFVNVSAMFIFMGNYFHYHFSAREKESDNSGNNFLLNEAIKIAMGQGAKIFHFGGGHTNSSEDSLLRFKSSFSKTRFPFFIGKRIHNEHIYKSLVDQWELRFPEKKEIFGNRILKYRY